MSELFNIPVVFSLQIALLAYLIGAIPSAYLIIKKGTGKDLRREGSGNIGALNSFEVSGKKRLGIAVFLADMLKGAIAVKLAMFLSGSNFSIACIAAFFAVLGHNYSVYIKFKGGRGLSTAVGVFLFLNPFVIGIWLTMWYIGFKIIRKHVHIGNGFASILAPILVYSAPVRILDMTLTAPYYYVDIYRAAVAAVCAIIFIKHIKALSDLKKTGK